MAKTATKATAKTTVRKTKKRSRSAPATAAKEDNASRRTLIEAAKKEFARNGLFGSRVDEIAKAAKKKMIGNEATSDDSHRLPAGS